MRIVIPCVLLVACAAGAFAAESWPVPGRAPTIAAALDSARAGDEVVVAAGTYFEHGLLLKPNVMLRGATGVREDVVIDGGGLGCVLIVNPVYQRYRVRDLTVANGVGTCGGGLGSPGGHYVAVVVANCLFRGNRGTAGGAVGNLRAGTWEFTDCVFEANEAASGGAIALTWASLVAVRCSFRDNVATGDGGSVATASTESVFDACEFSGNRAGGYGGALFFGRDRFSPPSANEVVFTGCLITANAAADGGGLALLDHEHPAYLGSPATHVRGLDACTIRDNSASGRGGGLLVDRDGGSLAATLSALGGNTAPAGPAGYVGGAGMNTVALVCCTTDILAWAGDGVLTVDTSCEGLGGQRDASWGGVKALYQP